MSAVPDQQRADRLFGIGREHRLAQRPEEALDAIRAAARLAPDDPSIALANARVHFETWRPAVEQARRAMALNPDDPAAVALLAMALAAAGDIAAADDLLARALTAWPGWQAGHQQLMQLRLTAGHRDGFDRTIAAACASQPANTSLRLAWFQTLVALRDWEQARKVIGARPGPAGDEAPMAMRLAALFLASESDEASRDPGLFDEVAGIEDVGLDIARTRFHLRIGQPERAAAIAQRRIGGPAARAFWPYLSLAWRQLGDPRSGWLDRDDTFITTIDLGLTPGQLGRLATALRSLLTMAAPFPEQSVRGGIQTDRQLFFHPDAAIVAVRDRAMQAARDYAERLPALDHDHPLSPRDGANLLFEGSWSVLLKPHGHHAPHTHSRGWLSSALHIELAGPAGDPDDQAGWIAFGSPPDELGLDLAATRTIRPSPGSVVLFPATTWHRTLPFDRGERLTIAFDVRQDAPRAGSPPDRPGAATPAR